MSKVDWKSIEQQVIALAIQIFGGYQIQVRADLKAFRLQTEREITEWVVEARNGNLTIAELQSLILGQKELLTLHNLKLRGIGHATLDKFVNGVMGIVFNAAKKSIGL
jgi:hypothetical protein